MLQKNQTPFQSALVISPNVDHQQTDKKFLRQAGISSVHCDASIKKGLAWLAANEVDVVLLDTDLGKTSGAKITQLLRKRRSLSALPIVLTSLIGDEASVFEALTAGCSGLLLRPYSMHSFVHQMHVAARNSHKGAASNVTLPQAEQLEQKERQAKATAACTKPPTPSNDADRQYHKGCRHLVAKHFGMAVTAFNKALAHNSAYTEAHIGLASAWQGLGDQDKARDTMRLAAKACARDESMQRIRHDIARTLMENPTTENPFLDLGFVLVRQGDFSRAGRAYWLASQYIPTGEAAYNAAARACYFTRAPMRSAKRLAQAMAQSAGSNNAAFLLKQIMGDQNENADGTRYGKASGSGLQAEPSAMHDLWAVLKYTYKIYRNGGPIGTPASPRMELL